MSYTFSKFNKLLSFGFILPVILFSIFAIVPKPVLAQSSTGAQHELFNLLISLKALIMQAEAIGAKVDTLLAKNVLDGLTSRIQGSTSNSFSVTSTIAPSSPYRPAGKRSSPPPPVVVQEAAPATYTVGGTFDISTNGLTVVMQLNGANDLSIDSDGSFTFDAELQSGDTYTVTFLTVPDGYDCYEYNDLLSGTVSNENISLEILCSDR